MSRPLRIEYENAYYHVMNRGAGKKNIFYGQKHYNLFLSLLNEIHNRYQIQIHAYCLMPNHYHLLINTPLANLSKALKYLNGIYTQRYNRLQKTDGALFRGRFKSIIVDKDNYLLTLNRYIHLNPVVSNIVKRVELYQWSSYAAYINPKLAPRWLTTNITLSKFGNKMQKQKYKTFIAEGLIKNTGDFLEKIKRLPILGSEAFIKTVTEKYLHKDKVSSEIPEQKELHKLCIPDITTIMQIVANYYNIDVIELKQSHNCKGKINNPRSIAIYFACLLSNQKLQTIADHFTSISYYGVSKAFHRCKRKMTEHTDIAQEMKAIENKITNLMSNVQI